MGITPFSKQARLIIACSYDLICISMLLIDLNLPLQGRY